VMAAASTTRYYFSTTTSKSGARMLSGSRAVPSLDPGAISSGTVTVTVSNTAAGTYFLLACSDDKFVVAEASESNNCKASINKVSVSGPDLTETGVADPPATAVDGSSFSVTDTVQNIGNVTAAASTTRYYFSTTTSKSGARMLSGSRAVPSLDPGATSSGTVAVTVSNTAAGTYFLLACSDDKFVIPEASESNNCKASANKTTVSGADLTETGVTDPPATVVDGSSFSVTDTVQNIGNVTAAGSTTRYYFSTTTSKSGARMLSGSRAVPSLDPGATSSGTVTVTVSNAAAGTYFLLACSDDKFVIPEASESNNCKASTDKTSVSGP
jgi:subtilase family serine protease